MNRLMNFGSQLQAFALSHVVTQLGYASELIDYQPLGAPPLSAARRVLHLACSPSALVTGYRRRQTARRWQTVNAPRLRATQEFSLRAYPRSETFYRTFAELAANPPRVDAAIAGSDQIWNPSGSNFGDHSYFLRFMPPEKRIAYAPSFAVDSVPEDKRPWLASAISEMRHLSVREEQGAAIVRELTGRTAEVVLDPTLLLTTDDWATFLPTPASAEPYVLQYVLDEDPYIRDRTRTIARRLGLRIVILPLARYDAVHDPHPNLWKTDVGPLEFLNLIKHAAFVCTDSFHGAILSLLHKRPFFVFLRYGAAEQAAGCSRMRSILGRCGLGARLLGRDDSSVNETGGIDYDAVHLWLQRQRTLSVSYLSNALSEVTACYVERSA